MTLVVIAGAWSAGTAESLTLMPERSRNERAFDTHLETAAI